MNKFKNIKYGLLVMAMVLSLAVFMGIPQKNVARAEESDANIEEQSQEVITFENLTTENSLDFLFQNNVAVPNSYMSNPRAGEIVYNIIQEILLDPDKEFVFSSRVTLDFIENIRTAVKRQMENCDMLVSIAETYADDDSSTEYHLVDSDLVFISGSDWFYLYNCYTYAIEQTFGETGHEVEPKELYEATAPTQDEYLELVKSIVISDFAAIGYTVISCSKQCPTVSAGQKLICFRVGIDNAGLQDYHFMKYTAGAWYHKPGWAPVLKYNRTPDSSVPWTNEFVKGDGIEYPPTAQYYGDIYYILYTSNRKEIVKHKWYYEVFDADDLYGVGICNEEHSNVVLMNDIFVASTYGPWMHFPCFKGFFAGNGHTISGLHFRNTVSTMNNIGFARENRGYIFDLTIKNVTINITDSICVNTESAEQDSNINIGIIAGLNGPLSELDNSMGKIFNCTVGGSGNYNGVYIYSTVKCNVGGICGTNYGEIHDCVVTNFHSSSAGNAGGITGVNICTKINYPALIYDSSVHYSYINTYWGNSGGIAGRAERPDTNHDMTVIMSGCRVNTCQLSCYNGYPNIFTAYYNVSDHFARVGGLVGCSEYYNLLSHCSVNDTKLSCESSPVDVAHGGNSFAPEIGFLGGRINTFEFDQNCYFVSFNVGCFAENSGVFMHFHESCTYDNMRILTPNLADYNSNWELVIPENQTEFIIAGRIGRVESTWNTRN